MDKEKMNAECMLGKQRVSECKPGAGCDSCGWNIKEHARRMQLPVERNGEGPRHKNISKPEEMAE